MPYTPWTNIYPDGPASAGSAGLPAAAGGGGNAAYPGMPEGATPVHRDFTTALAGTYSIWSPTPSRRFILASAFLSSDTAMRIALIDDTDIQGNRPVDQYAVAGGGSSPNLVPVPYPSKVVGAPLRLVTAAAGNVRIRVSGWETEG
jgi:hypothetical protein